MKTILLISFALVFFGGCGSSNPVAADTSCTAGGCTATGCASDCACGCGGVTGADGCTCATSCACANDDDDSSTTNAVSIAGINFSPSTTTISKGTTVTWTNNSTSTHSVVSDDGSSETWNSDDLLNGVTFQHTFYISGEFNYHCGRHSIMTGTIIVQE